MRSSKAGGEGGGRKVQPDEPLFTREVAVAQVSRSDRRSSNRRQFLVASGLTACTLELAAAEEGTKKPLVKPTSGVAGIKKLLAGKDALTWVLTGDSITHGALHTKGW